MTEDFKNVLKNESNLCKVVLEVMSLDMDEEEAKKLTSYRPFLSLVDNYITYYQKKADSSVQVPIFYMLGANDDMRKLLAKYLTIRLGVFNEKAISKIRKDIAFIAAHGLHIPTAGTQEYKSFNRKVQYEGKPTCFGYALTKFKRKINTIASSLTDTDKSEYSLLICKDQEVCDSRYSLLVDFFEPTYKRERSLYVNPDVDANALKEKVKAYYKNNREPVSGNAFMVYYNSNRFKSFSKGRIEQISQLGFDIKNLFVFVLVDQNYTVGKVLSDKTRLERIFNVGRNYNDFFCLQFDEILELNPSSSKPNYKRYFSQIKENDDILRSEIAVMLDGVRFPTSKRNILSLCAGPASKEAFFNYLTEEDPDYQRPDHPVVFNYIQNQWRTEIREQVLSFLSPTTLGFAMVIDGYTPSIIKEEICELFPSHDIQFYKVGDLKLVKGSNQILRRNIVVLRFMRYYKEASIYPNSYDPYYLEPNQRLLEIINVPIFQKKLDVSNYELNSTYNKLLGIDYRKDVLGWKAIPKSRPVGDSDAGFYMEYDSGDYSYSQNKLSIVTIDGKKRTIPESELLIVEEDEHIELVRASDLLEEYEGKKIQLASDLESHLTPLIEKSVSKDSNLEEEIRRQFISEIGQSAVKSKEELWRLLLEWKVLQFGEERVYDDVIEKAGLSLKMNAFKNWYDFDYQMILPRDRQSMDSVLRYLGFEVYGTYYIIMRRKKIRQKNKTRNQNSLLDELLNEIFKFSEDLTTYKEMERNIPDSLDLIGIDSEEYLHMVTDDVLSQLNLKEVKQIKRYGE